MIPGKLKVKEAKGLSTDLAASLGRMIARFAMLERLLALIMYSLAGVDAKTGRVAIGAPRISDYPRRMQQLGQVLKIDMSMFPWNDYQKTLEELKTQRDIFAHGHWLIDVNTKQYLIVDTTGTWPAPPNTKPISKKIYPEGRKVTPSDLTSLRKKIDKAIADARTLDRFVQILLQTYVRKPS